MEHYDFSIIRDLRKGQGKTIADVAEISGISAAVISRIERNQASPELSTLYRLGKVFGIKATDLLALAEASEPQITAAQRYTSGGFQFQHIHFLNLKCFLGAAFVGDSLTSRPEVHHNDYEICWVLEGKMEMVINDDPHILSQGEAIQFDAVLQHTYRALTDCKILLLHMRKGASAPLT